ncbi:MAG: hypothetical protein Q9220_002542 [cf. Caloplaca sp. 1 TL-2023]
MGPRGGRAREKGGLSRLNVSENEYASSNSTTAKFLGGPQKSWMTGQVGVTDISRGPNRAHCTVEPQPYSGSGHALPTHYVPTLQHLRSSMQKDPAVDGAGVEAVLPSPAPTDENGESNSAAPRRRSWSSELGEPYEGIDRSEDAIRTPPSSATLGNLEIQPFATTSELSAANRASNDGRLTKRRKPNTPRPSHVEIPSLGPLCHTPTDAQIEDFVQAIIARQKLATHHIATRGDTESPRLSLLRQACVQRDYIYLFLHQLYCVDIRVPSNIQRLERIGLGPLHLKGLAMLHPLLLSNSDRLVEEAVSWFADFPYPIERMLQEYGIYRDALKSTLVCLVNLAFNWIGYRESCNKRDYPPLVDELVDRLGMESSVLQSVISRAIFKDTWHDACFAEGEEIFQQNQQIVQRRPTQLSSVNKNKTNQDMIARYRRLRITHDGHSRTELHNGAPPVQQSNTRMSSTSSRVQGQLNGAQNRPRVSSANDQIRRSPALNIGNPDSTTARNPPVVPSQPLLHERQSPMIPQGIHWTLLATPNGVSQAMVGHQPGSTSSPNMVLPHRQDLIQQQWALPAPRIPSGAPASFSPNPNFAQNLQPIHDVPRQMSIANNLRQMTDYWPLIPPPGRTLTQQSLARPDITAIHQHNAVSPILKAEGCFDEQNSGHKRFRCLKGVTILPDRLMVGFRQHLSWNFDLGEDDLRLLSGTLLAQLGIPPTRAVHVGSEFRRIRCVDAAKLGDSISESDWATARQTWPSNVAVILNNKSFDIRKKVHYGKDLPVDITASLQPGRNTLSVSIIGAQKAKTKTAYAIGIETIELIDTDKAMNSIGVLNFQQGRQRILERLQSNDAEIEVVDTSVVISLTDPYTARIWDTPIRGKLCRHDQCFDLDTFLKTRTGKTPSQPCDPDAFKCPICGNDARPQSLVKDEFFVSLRTVLVAMDRLDAKAIIMQQDGSWQIQEEEKTGEAGDGSGKRGTGVQQTPECERGCSRTETIEID